jgi:Cu2+-exporting ATPase
MEIDGSHVATIYFRESNDLAAAKHVERLRIDRGLHVMLATQRAEADAARLAREVGADGYQSGLANGSLAQYLRECRARGQRVAIVGPDRVVADAAAEAHVTIGVVEDADAEACRSQISLLEPGLCRLIDVWEVAASRSARTREARHFTLVPNVLCVAGAFFLGFTSLVAVIVSNVGTFGSYWFAAEQIRRSHRIGQSRNRPLSFLARGSNDAAR